MPGFFYPLRSRPPRMFLTEDTKSGYLQTGNIRHQSCKDSQIQMFSISYPCNVRTRLPLLGCCYVPFTLLSQIHSIHTILPAPTAPGSLWRIVQCTPFAQRFLIYLSVVYRTNVAMSRSFLFSPFLQKCVWCILTHNYTKHHTFIHFLFISG